MHTLGFCRESLCPLKPCELIHRFYRAMHYSAKRGIAIACRPSVRPSVTLVDQAHIGWKSWKLIARAISLTRSLLYRAHRAVIFAIAQLSCKLFSTVVGLGSGWLNIYGRTSLAYMRELREVAYLFWNLSCRRTFWASDMDTETTMMMTPTMTTGFSDNVTSITPPSDDDYFSFVLYEVVVPILYGIVTALGVTGNSLVIYVIVSKERMRTVINFLLLNLAIADLSFVVVIPPSTAYVFAANR